MFYMENIMEIKKIELRYIHKNGCEGIGMNNVQHTKTLPWLSIVQSQEGSYDIQLNDAPMYQTGDGGFFIAPSQVVQNIIHHVNPGSQRMRIRWIFLDVIINDQYRLDTLYDFPNIIPAEPKEQMNTLFDQLFSTEDLCDEMSIYYQIIKLLLQMAVPKNTATNKFLLHALDHIQEHYSEELTMKQLSTITCISEPYLYEIFRNNLGTSPIAYLNYYRLSVASEMLRQTNEPVRKIAELVGFRDPAYFTRLFCRTFGCSPRDYKKGML